MYVCILCIKDPFQIKCYIVFVQTCVFESIIVEVYIQINHLVYPWSSLRVCGSRRSIAGGLYGPIPSLVAAAILTEYITPDVKLASIKVGEDASAVILVKIFDILYVSKPRTIIW